MQLCINCLRELFDLDTRCDNCGSNNLINNIEYNQIKNEIIGMNTFKRTKAIKNEKYNAIYNHLTKKYGDRYWREIKSKPNSEKILYSKPQPSKPTIQCPYCKGTNTSKISTTAKVINTGLFGMFGTKRFKEWQCNECKSKF